tara:strand:+ start:294 stop:407 length:114 start_codon:yes stop_codon:yes gene_type:complete
MNLKIVDVLWREIKVKNYSTLFYIYENGKAEKRIILE